MPKVTPSQVVNAIDQMFGPSRNVLDSGQVNINYRIEVGALLSVLEEVPRDLIALPFQEYLSFSRCCASLSAAAAMWNTMGQGPPARAVGGHDPISVLRQLLAKCPDELPPHVDLAFIPNEERRSWITDRAEAAWVDFGAREWLGCTVMAGAAVEGLLLWGLDGRGVTELKGKPLDQLHLSQLITLAENNGLLSAAVCAQARQANDARNLVHPGRVAREQVSASRGTALAGLAALDQVIAELRPETLGR